MLLGGWPRISHERALRNARAAALEVSQRRIEHAEVARFMSEESEYDPTPPERRRTRRKPARATDDH